MIIVNLKVKKYFNLKAQIGKSVVEITIRTGQPKALNCCILCIICRCYDLSCATINSLLFLWRIVIKLWHCSHVFFQ